MRRMSVFMIGLILAVLNVASAGVGTRAMRVSALPAHGKALTVAEFCQQAGCVVPEAKAGIIFTPHIPPLVCYCGGVITSVTVIRELDEITSTYAKNYILPLSNDSTVGGNPVKYLLIPNRVVAENFAAHSFIYTVNSSLTQHRIMNLSIASP